jgi:hypothetical protein
VIFCVCVCRFRKIFVSFFGVCLRTIYLMILVYHMLYNRQLLTYKYITEKLFVFFCLLN